MYINRSNNIQFQGNRRLFTPSALGVALGVTMAAALTLSACGRNVTTTSTELTTSSATTAAVSSNPPEDLEALKALAQEFTAINYQLDQRGSGDGVYLFNQGAYRLSVINGLLSGKSLRFTRESDGTGVSYSLRTPGKPPRVNMRRARGGSDQQIDDHEVCGQIRGLLARLFVLTGRQDATDYLGPEDVCRLPLP